MREDIQPGGEGSFTNFADLMKYFKMSLDRCPNGIRLSFGTGLIEKSRVKLNLSMIGKLTVKSLRRLRKIISRVGTEGQGRKDLQKIFLAKKLLKIIKNS
ncbi:MAG: hypothetical protein SWJ54_22015, partial [Cyanobacteriota bacterium]|nr:hypothetical protein [Cyanobacteriota bacterium]